MMIKLKTRHVLVLTIAAVRVFLLGWAGVEAADHTKDSLETVKKRIADDKAVLVDVRELEEWEAGHIEKAVFAPLTKLADSNEAPEVKKKLPKDKILYFHCKSGGRCKIAADLLKNEKLDIRPLKAGYKELLEAGFQKAKECAGDDFVSISGQVVFDDKPLTDGRIFFHSDNDQFVGSKITKDGKYRVDRIAAGTYTVTFESKGIPSRYSSKEKSKYRVKLPMTDTIDFVLSK